MSEIINAEIEKKEKGKVDELEIKGLPMYMENIELTESQNRRLFEDWRAEFDEICKERSKYGFEDKVYSLRRQYEGVTPSDLDLEFQLHKHTTKTKCDVVRRHMLQAFLEPEPRIAVNPRPEFQRQDGENLTEDIEDFLDYAMDERMNTFRPTFSKVLKDAIGAPVGIMKMTHMYREVRKNRVERFSSVEDFMNRYPDAKQVDEYQSIINDLTRLEDKNADKSEDKKEYIEYVSNYKEVVCDDPYPSWVDPIKFYCRMSVDNYEDLKYTRLKTEEKEYTWWELQQLQRDGVLNNIDILKYEEVKGHEGTSNYIRPEKMQVRKGYEYETYKIMESDFWFKVNEDDEEETRIIFWHDKEREIIIGCIHYPYYYVDSCYFPFWVDDSTQGWMKKCLSDYMSETNLAEDIMLNLMLQYYYIRATITPISAENSPTQKQFLENRWTWGMNIDTDGRPIDFAQRYLQSVPAQDLIAVIQYMVQGDDDVTGVSSLMSGRESPIDPQAPAAKTIALLEKSGISIKDYIKCLAPSFNEVANAIMMLYYQFSEEDGMKFRSRASRVTGKEIFRNLKRSDMAARVNIQTQAMVFNFEKKNEKQEDVALLQILRAEPLLNNNPEAVWYMIRNIIKNWSPKWRKLVDKIMPNIQQFRQDQLKLIIQGVAMYGQQQAMQSQMTGQPPALDVNQFVGQLQMMLKEAVTPPSPEEVKAREKAAKEKGS